MLASLRTAVALTALARAAARPQRQALLWVEPYANWTTVADYQNAWAQVASYPQSSQYVIAGSAYAAEDNATHPLGYATTSAGEGLLGQAMEQLGFPALVNLNLTFIGMTYITHYAAIARIVADPQTFIAALLAKAEAVPGLKGFDFDYEPQQIARAGVSAADFMSFLDLCASALAAKGLMLTIDVGGCEGGGSDAFQCSLVGTIPMNSINTMDSFGTSTVAGMRQLQRLNQGPLGARWAPGFEPGNLGESTFTTLFNWLASPAANVSQIATWEVHEYNVGPQPEWLFAGINAFLDGGA